MLVWLPEDGDQLPKQGTDIMCIFVCASCWLYKRNYISLHGMNNVKTLHSYLNIFKIFFDSNYIHLYFNIFGSS